MKKLGSEVKANGAGTVLEVCLARTRTTDAGLRHLKRLPKLKTLNLYDTQVTDAGLKQLKGMNLRSPLLGDVQADPKFQDTFVEQMSFPSAG